MVSNCLHIVWHWVTNLSAEVSIELSVVAAKEVSSSLVVVLSQVPKESRSHVVVVWSRADGRVHHRARNFVIVAGNEPHR